MQRAEVFAKKLRRMMPYHPLGDTMHFKNLRGKPVEYVDAECRVRVHRCIEVKGLKELKLQDFVSAVKDGKATGQPRAHWIRVDVVVGAFARKGTNYRQEVIF